MGKRGPQPKPTQLRLLHGDRKDRINTAEPVPRQALPQCPGDVSPAVREVWDYTLAELSAMRLVSAADRDSLLCYCEAVVVHRNACAVLAKTTVLGETTVLVEGKMGGLVRNPALQIQRDSAAVIRGFAQEFGLTPASRSQIKTEGGRSAPGEDLLTG